jgi:hypothetical protein
MKINLRLVAILLTITMLTIACSTEDEFADSIANPNTDQHTNPNTDQSKADSAQQENYFSLENPIPIQTPNDWNQDESWQQKAEDLYQNYMHQVETTSANAPVHPSECDSCGRETGFLPPPDLEWISFYDVEDKNTTIIDISWDHIENHEYYEISLFKIEGNEAQSTNMYQWQTTRNQVELPLSIGYFYVFFVETINQSQGLRSKASSPVMIDCLEEECRLLFSQDRH